LYSSRVLLAEEALELGLVNRVFAPGRLMDETLAYARTLASEVALSSLRAIKQQLWSTMSLDEAWRDANERMVEMVASAEFAEGVAAFQEKRPPRFPR
jgi:enoyl-CoA hydratase/carnithine racemase